MGLDYDERGCAVVDPIAVASAVEEVARQKAARAPNWRIRNLGKHARPRPKAVDGGESVARAGFPVPELIFR